MNMVFGKEQRMSDNEMIYRLIRQLVDFIDLRHKGLILLDEKDRLMEANSRVLEIFDLDPQGNVAEQLREVFAQYGVTEDTEFFYDVHNHQINVKYQKLDAEGGPVLKAWIFEVLGMETMRKKILENVVQYCQDGIHAVDQNGNLIIYNDAQGKIDHYEPKAVIGRHTKDVYSLDENSSLLLRVLKTREPIENVRQVYYTRKGTLVDCVTSVVPLFYHGKIFGSFAIVRDYNAVLHLLKEDYGSGGKARRLAADPNYEKKNARYTFADIIYVNPDMEKCIQTAKMAAQNDSNILIIGETGTGKEMFAQSIHNFSSRREKPFLAINCAAIPETLLESLLFGTTKGSFTGAMDKAGLFEEADGGTVFLDEINSMSILLQSKLLRVLEERMVTRIGSNHTIRIDIRIISSCNENPVYAVRENRIRQDLFYRLAVHYIVIPSLRMRRDDIPVLAEYYIARYNEKMGKNVRTLDADVVRLFVESDWPGNVRQLSHVLEAAMNMVGRDEDCVAQRHLPEYFFHTGEESGDVESDRIISQEESGGPGLLEQIREEEKDKIVGALKRNGGNVARTARELGMSRQKLYYRIKIYGL